MVRIKKVKSFDKSQWRGSPLVESYQDLVDAVKARQPLIFIDTYDYETVDMMLKALEARKEISTSQKQKSLERREIKKSSRREN